MSRAQKIGMAIWLFVIVAALANMVYESSRADQAGDWPSVNGRVVDSGVISNSGGRGNSTTWSPTVRYQYRVNGRMLTGERIWLSSGLSYASAEEAEDFLTPYRPGAPVAVYYNPANPADSALMLDNLGPMMIILIVIGLIGIVATYYWPRMVAASERYRTRVEAGRAGQS